MVKECDVVCHRLDGLSMFVGVLQDLIARDDAPLHFIKDDMAPKLDLGSALVPRDGPCVWLEEAEDLLVGGDGSAFEDPVARLRDHPLDQREYALGLAAPACDLRLRLLTECRHHTAGLLHHPFGDFYELLVQLLLLCLFLFA